MTISHKDKTIVSLLPLEDARQVLLALFSEEGDLPEMTPLAIMAYSAVKSKNRQIITDKSKSSPSEEGLQEQRFSEFWTVYPRKIGKEAAWKAWRRINPTAEHHSKILAAIEQAKNSSQWKRDSGQYIPNPATWLNQGRWDDEIPPNNKTPTNRVYTGYFNQREYDDEFYEQFVSKEFGQMR